MLIRVFLNTIFKHLRKIILFVVFAQAVAFFGFLLKTPHYQTSAKIFIKLGREIVKPSQDSLSTVIVAGKDVQDIQTEIDILKSQILAEQTVQRVGAGKVLENHKEKRIESILSAAPYLKEVLSRIREAIGEEEDELPPFQRAVTHIQKNLKVMLLTRTEVLRVSYGGVSPNLSVEILEAFTKAYIDRHLKVHMAPKSVEVLQGLADEWQVKLEEANRNLELLGDKWAGLDFMQYKQGFLTELMFNAHEAEEAQMAVDHFNERIKLYQERIKSEPQYIKGEVLVGRNPVLEKLNSVYLELQVAERELLEKYRPESRFVQEVSDKLKLVRESIKKEKKTITETEEVVTNMIHSYLALEIKKIQSDIQSHTAIRSGFLEVAEKYREELPELFKDEKEYNKLQRQKNTAYQNYLLYIKKLEEARSYRIMDMAKVSNAHVIEPPFLPSKPNGPGLLMVLVLTGGIGSLVALILAFLIEFNDSTFRSREAVESKLNLSVLGAISAY